MKNHSSTSEIPGDRAPVRLPVWRAFGAPAAGLVLVVIAGRLAGSHWPAVEAQIGSLGPWGYPLFVVAWVVLACACFPVSVLGVSAGALFGLAVGLGLVFASGMLGAALMFALARGLLRGRIRRVIADRPRLGALDRLAGEKAMRLNILTRLSPLNYGLACYTLAAGRTGFGTYLLGNLATLPSMVFHVCIGAFAMQAGQSLADEGFTARNLLLLAGGVVFLGLLSWQIGRLVRQAVAGLPAKGEIDTGLNDPEATPRRAPHGES